MDANNIVVRYANAEHAVYAEHICQLIYESALQRGTGISYYDIICNPVHLNNLLFIIQSIM